MTEDTDILLLEQGAFDKDKTDKLNDNNKELKTESYKKNYNCKKFIRELPTKIVMLCKSLSWLYCFFAIVFYTYILLFIVYKVLFSGE